MKVQMYPNNSLFKDGKEMAAVQLDSVQLLAAASVSAKKVAVCC